MKAATKKKLRMYNHEGPGGLIRACCKSRAAAILARRIRGRKATAMVSWEYSGDGYTAYDVRVCWNWGVTGFGSYTFTNCTLYVDNGEPEYCDECGGVR